MVPFTASQIQEFRGCTGRGGDSNEEQRLNMQAAVCRAIHGGPSTPPHSQKLSLGGRFNSAGPAAGRGGGRRGGGAGGRGGGGGGGAAAGRRRGHGAGGARGGGERDR